MKANVLDPDGKENGNMGSYGIGISRLGRYSPMMKVE